MTGIKLYLFINKVIPQRAIKTLEKSFLKKNQETGQGEDKRNGLKTTDEQHLKVMSLRYRGEKISRDLTADVRDAFGPSVDSSTVHRSLTRHGFNGKVAVKTIREGNREERLRYSTLHKDWTENQQREV